MVTICLVLQLLYVGKVRAAAVTSGHNVPNGSADAASAPALDDTEVFDFQDSSSIPSEFQLSGEVSTNIRNERGGARLTISRDSDASALVLPGHFQYGRVEVFVKSVIAAGFVIAVRIRSDASDELALELLGAEESLVARSVYCLEGHEINSPDPETTKAVTENDEYHNLTIDWTSQSVHWFADGALVGSLAHGSDTLLSTFNQVALTAEVRDAPSIELERTDMSRALYLAEVMNMTITHYRGNSIKALQNTDGDIPSTERILQRWSTPESQPRHWSGKRSDLRPRIIQMSDKTKLAFGLTVGIGGGSLIFLVIFALFRVNGYCRFRRKKDARAIYSGEMRSRGMSPRTTQTTLVNSPQQRGDGSRNTYYYSPRSDRRHTNDSTAKGQSSDQDGIFPDRRHSHYVLPGNQRHTLDALQKERRYTQDRSPQERRHTHDRSHPYRRYTQDDRSPEYRRYIHEERSPGNHRQSPHNRSPGNQKHTQDGVTGDRRHTRDSGQNHRMAPHADRNNREGRIRDQKHHVTPAVSSGGNKHKPAETSKNAEKASKPKTESSKQPPPIIPEEEEQERKPGPFSFLLPGLRKKAQQPKKPPSARVPSIAELDGQGVSEQLATVIKRRHSLEKKPLPTAPQLTDSDLAARNDDGCGQGSSSDNRVVRYNIFPL